MQAIVESLCVKMKESTKLPEEKPCQTFNENVC